MSWIAACVVASQLGSRTSIKAAPRPAVDEPAKPVPEVSGQCTVGMSPPAFPHPFHPAFDLPTAIALNAVFNPPTPVDFWAKNEADAYRVEQ